MYPARLNQCPRGLEFRLRAQPRGRRPASLFERRAQLFFRREEHQVGHIRRARRILGHGAKRLAVHEIDQGVLVGKRQQFRHRALVRHAPIQRLRQAQGKFGAGIVIDIGIGVLNLQSLLRALNQSGESGQFVVGLKFRRFPG